MTESLQQADWPKQASSGVIRLVQHNDNRQVRIAGLSEALVWLLGFDQEVLKDQELRSILTSQMADAIDEQVEFSDDGVDIAEMLNKYRDPALLTATGEVVPVEIKLHNAGLEGGHLVYDMVVKTAGLEEMRTHDQTMAHSMAIRGEEILDDAVGIPDRDSFVKDVELLLHLLQQNPEGESCVLLVRLCNYKDVLQEREQAVADRLLKLCSYTCRDNIRHDDIVARIADDTMAVLLLDTDMKAVPIVINRIRMALNTLRVAGEGGELVAPELSYALTQFEVQDTAKSIVQLLDETVQGVMSAASGSAVIQMRV